MGAAGGPVVATAGAITGAAGASGSATALFFTIKLYSRL